METENEIFYMFGIPFHDDCGGQVEIQEEYNSDFYQKDATCLKCQKWWVIASANWEELHGFMENPK